jgi:hypothetical protein
VLIADAFRLVPLSLIALSHRLPARLFGQMLHSYESRSYRPDFTNPRLVNKYSGQSKYRTDAALVPK